MVTRLQTAGTAPRTVTQTSSRRHRPAGSIRVLIVDDHTMFRTTLRLLLESYNELSVIGEAGDGREALTLAERLKPDVILMDIVMPGLNGIEATAQIRKRLPFTKVLVLSGYSFNDRVAAAIDAGAHGYVLKSSTPDELLLGILSVSSSRSYLAESLRSKFVELGRTRARPGGGSGAPLSAREREIVQLVAEGHSQISIAQRLSISVKTVETHKENIAQKLGIRGTAELIHYAIRKGLIHVERDAEVGLEAAG